MLTINLLGAPDILWHETRVDLPRRQARALLYRLAADPRPVARERLIYLFWPDMPDMTARKNLSRLVSFLRSSLPEPGLLEVGRESIGLDARRVACDGREFAGLLEAGDPSALERAVALYRGSFLSGFWLSKAPEFENWAALESERYERLFLNTLAQLMEVKSSSGELTNAVRYGQQYLAIDNLAEGIHRQLITFYMMLGKRTSALRQYEECVATLERELGVAPLPQTRAAYEAALADQGIAAAPDHDAQLAITWTVLPSLELPLIGRQETMRQLDRAFERAQSGGFIFISGEPGIGKSRLLQEFASSRRQRLVLAGNGYESTRDLPYQPLVQALRPTLAIPDLWRTIRPIWLSEVAAILPEVADHFDGLPDRVQVEPEQAQTRLFEALTQVMAGLAGRQPLLLCLDDLHWADEATLAFLSYLAGRLPESAICIMATFRTQEARSLNDLRQTLRRAALQVDVTLSGLPVEAIAAILDQLGSASNDQPFASDLQPLATTIHQATAGNAFFVLETIRALLEQESLADPPAGLPMPKTVQETIRGRLERLDPLSRQVLDAAAVVYPGINLQLLGSVAGRSEPEVVDAIEALLGRQLLASLDDTLQFQHELARVVVYEDLSHWRRRLLHKRAAEALTELHRSQQDQTAAQIARHYEAAGEIDLACSFYRDAAGVAQSLYAYREANHYLQRIIDLQAGKPIDPQITGRLYESQADNLRAMAQFDAAESAYRRALEITPDEPSLWRADVLRKVAAVIKPELRFEEADDLYSLALDIIDQAPVNAQVDRRRFWLRLQLDRLDLYYLQGRLADMVKLTAAVGPVVQDVDEPFLWSQYYAANTRMRAHQERFAFSSETVRIGRERLRHAKKSDNVRETVEQRFGLGFVLLWAGEVNEADEILRRALAESEEIGHTYIQIQCLTYLSIVHRFLGDTILSGQYLRRSQEIRSTKKHRYYVGVDHSTKAWLSYKRSDWQGAFEQSRAALALWENTIYPFAWLANWIILAYGLETADLAVCFEAAAQMLRPEQQRLPDEVTAALTEAVAANRSGDEATGRAALSRARELAETFGYL